MTREEFQEAADKHRLTLASWARKWVDEDAEGVAQEAVADLLRREPHAEAKATDVEEALFRAVSAFCCTQAIEQHRPALIRYAAKRVGAAAAEDVLAEAVATIFARESFLKFRGDSTAKTWLVGIVKKHCAEWARDRGRRARPTSEGAEEEPPTPASPVTTLSPDGSQRVLSSPEFRAERGTPTAPRKRRPAPQLDMPLEDAEAAPVAEGYRNDAVETPEQVEQRVAIANALNNIADPTTRELIERHLLHGHSLVDLAAERGVSPRSLQHLLQPDLRKLREALRHYAPTAEDIHAD